MSASHLSTHPSFSCSFIQLQAFGVDIIPFRIDDGMLEFKLDPDDNRTGDIWHICIQVGQKKIY